MNCPRCGGSIIGPKCTSCNREAFVVVFDEPQDFAFIKELARRDSVSVERVLQSITGWVRENSTLPPEYDEPWKMDKQQEG